MKANLARVVATDTWFSRVSARPLAALRIALPLLLLAHLVWISSDLLALHGTRGIIPWELTDLLRNSWLPGLPTLAKAFQPFGIGADTAIIVLLSVYAGALLALSLGFHSRVSAFLAWGLHLSLVTSGFASFYGVDRIANTFLFYLMLFPTGRASNDPMRDETVPAGCLRVMQIHLCVVYLGAGLDKAVGHQWWTGEAIWQAVSQPSFRTFDLAWMAWHPWVPMLAGWLTLLVEVGYVFFIWPRRTRTLWCIATIGLHLGLATFMGLVFFSSLMILLTGCLFLVPEQAREARGSAILLRPRAAAIPLALALLVFGHGARSEAVLPDNYVPLVRHLMARDQIPGVAVGVIERGQLVETRTFGYRDVEHRLPVTADTLFALGSCSKAFTAAAIAVLADEGRVALDVPVRTYLPDFSLADPDASATLTTRDLLTHRSGLPRHDLFWYRAPFSRDELYRRLRFLEPSAPPRARWRYNSLMYVVAGRIVERISGASWERFVRDRVLAPLEMHRTLLSAEAMAADPDHASPYALREGRVQRIPILTRTTVFAPAGGVQSTLHDLARWIAFHATNTPRLVGDGIWNELHRAQAEMPAPDQPEIERPFYALGWVRESYRGHPLVVHDGAIDGYTVHLGYLPETGQGVVILANRDNASAALRALAYTAYDHLLALDPIDWAARLEDRSNVVDAVRDVALDFPIGEVVGRYTHPAYGVITVRRAGHRLALRFRALHVALAYQGDRSFRSLGPLADGSPQISVRFSTPMRGEPQKLFVALTFDLGDPIEEFTRVGTHGATHSTDVTHTTHRDSSRDARDRRVDLDLEHRGSCRTPARYPNR